MNLWLFRLLWPLQLQSIIHSVWCGPGQSTAGVMATSERTISLNFQIINPLFNLYNSIFLKRFKLSNIFNDCRLYSSFAVWFMTVQSSLFEHILGKYFFYISRTFMIMRVLIVCVNVDNSGIVHCWKIFFVFSIESGTKSIVFEGGKEERIIVIIRPYWRN